MANFNFSTLNTPKHFVALGREAGKSFTRATKDDLYQRISDNLRRGAGISTSYYSLVPVPLNRLRFNDLDIIVAKEGLPSNWMTRLRDKVFDGGFHAPIPGTNTVVFEYRGYQINVHAVDNASELRRAILYLGQHGLMGLAQIVGESLGIEYDMNSFKLKTGVPTTPTLEIQYSQYNEYRILGMSPDFIVHHIYTNEDIYKAVFTGAFFNRKVFLDLEAQPDYAVRTAKNPILKSFVDYLKANPSLSGEVRFDPTSARDRIGFTQTFKSYSGQVFTQHEDLVRAHQLYELTQAKFSVEKMSAVTGLTGVHLKRVMDLFAQAGFKSEKAFNHFIITSLPESINAHILAVRDKVFPGGVEAALKAEEDARVAAIRAKKKPLTEKQVKKVEVDELKAKLKTAKPVAKPKVAKAKVAKAVSRATEDVNLLNAMVASTERIREITGNEFALAA